MNNLKNLAKIILALGLLAGMMFFAFMAFLILLGVAAIVAIGLYVRSVLPKNKRDDENATYYYSENSEIISGEIIEGEVIADEPNKTAK